MTTRKKYSKEFKLDAVEKWLIIPDMELRR